jgi:hypothetical protein
MKFQFIQLAILTLTTSILFSQDKRDVVFKDTLFLSINNKDFILLETTEKEEIYFRKEEEGSIERTYFFGFQKIKKPKSNFDLIDLNEFLRKEHFYNEKAQRFKYDNIFKRFYDNVIIFVDEKCLGNKFYLINTIIFV